MESKKSKFKFIDLFSGIGAFHQAMESLGGECVFASDIDKYAIETYYENYNMDSNCNIRDVKENPVKLISDGWGLLTAGKESGWNTMTVSWGAIGELWGRDVALCFVRPQR